MMVLQVAAGIILAVLVLRFWKQSLRVVAGVAVLAAITLVALWVGANWIEAAVLVTLFVVGAGVTWVVRRGNRAAHES